MFLLYHSEECNICEMVLHECYVNDLHTTTCSGMLGHHSADVEIADRDAAVVEVIVVAARARGARDLGFVRRRQGVAVVARLWRRR
jgi:hypothetical protein